MAVWPQTRFEFGVPGQGYGCFARSRVLREMSDGLLDLMPLRGMFRV